MGKTKGPDMMVTDAPSLRESAWLPTTRLMPAYDWSEVFGNSHPVEIELGCGDGGFILTRAQQHPERNFLAVERLLGRARKVAKAIAREQRQNLKALRLESSYVIERLSPPASVSMVHIMFPDPWPKARHHKRRLIQPTFLESLHRALVPGGAVRFSTDHEGYFEWARDMWTEAAGWSIAPIWDYTNDPPTEFQQLWDGQGRPTHRLHVIRKI